MKIFPLLIALIFVAAPVAAQEKSADAVTPKRLELAGQMHEIWPIRTRIETALDGIAQNFPEERRAEIKAAMRKSIQFDQVQEASIRAMAETFTEEELEEMIRFYGSDVGRSISAKTADYEMALRPVFMQMLDKAALDLRTGSAQ